LRSVARIVAAALAGAMLAAPASAGADPLGRWEAARGPLRHAAEIQALEAADRQLAEGLRLRALASAFDPLASTGLFAHQQEARRLLEAVGGAAANDPRVRLRYGEVLSDLRLWSEAVPVLEGVVDQVPASSRVDAWVELAIAYARTGRGRDEIACYERALAHDPHGASRATILANEAEAFMAVGDVTRAVAGYRAALEPLTTAEEIADRAPTTLWGLGVALDRAGELDAALDAIQRARAYDPADARLSGPGWFFNPTYDEAWYAGLGHLLVARRGPDLDVRRSAYGRAIEAFREYVDTAPQAVAWVATARARVVALTTEQARFEKRLAQTQRESRPIRPSAPSPASRRPTR